MLIGWDVEAGLGDDECHLKAFRLSRVLCATGPVVDGAKWRLDTLPFCIAVQFRGGKRMRLVASSSYLHSHPPSYTPSYLPSYTPSLTPSLTLSLTPSYPPSYTPSLTPSYLPSYIPSFRLSHPPFHSPFHPPSPSLSSATLSIDYLRFQ